MYDLTWIVVTNMVLLVILLLFAIIVMLYALDGFYFLNYFLPCQCHAHTI